ncbi:MAG TPA: helix-turn-helix transcriptional regulator [Micromonosporaceae bacterium]
MGSPQGPVVLRRRLAMELRRLRTERELTVDQAAVKLGWSESKLSRIETAKTGVGPANLAGLIRLYEVDSEEAEHLIELDRRARRPGWWRKYSDVLPSWYSAWVGLESEARVIRTYQAQIVPGLFQTQDYAHAVLSAGVLPELPEEVDRKVKLRLARQALFTRDDPPHISVVLDEAVLRRAVGGPETMRAQLAHLLELAKLRNVELHVLPFEVGIHPGINGSFEIFEFEPEDPKLVYVDTLTEAIYPDKPREVGRYSMCFEQLRGAALNVADSLRMIAAAEREFAKRPST